MAPAEISLSLRPEQRMLMLPRMLQALDILQLPREALSELLNSAAGENEALTRRRTRAPRARGGEAAFENRAAGCSLSDYLQTQIAELDVNDRIRSLLDHVAQSLDASGYRNITDRELAAALSPAASAAELQQCDDALALLDPPGAGARGVFDAILRQIYKNDPDRGLVEQILQKYAVDLTKNRHDAVARALDLSIDELYLLLKKIRKFAARPASGFSAEETARVAPDVTVKTTESGVELTFRDDREFTFEISKRAVELSRDRTLDGAERAQWKERVEAARTLLTNLEQRRATLERVIQAIFARQKAFLQNGRDYLRPLRMQDLAEELSVHPSTISRAVAGKYAETPFGIYKLRDFFVNAVELTTGETATRDELKTAIQNAFAGEDRNAPLDDGAVVLLLKSKGFDVARRTIAKYRADLGIPSSWHRGKALAAAANS